MENSNPDTDAKTTQQRLESRTLSQFASIGVISCTRDTPLSDVAELMAVNRVHAIVVIDDERPEPPVISDLDLIGALASGHFDELRAADIAGTEAVSLGQDDTLAHAAQLLADHRASHLIVRDERRNPVGVVSTLDIAAAISLPG
jgi:CBS domain-containing protein